jgi:pimeloyl-ACP methyl ester carboxylesterase
VQVPTLIMQREGDRIVRAGTAAYLAEHIRGSRLCLLPGEDHHLWAGDVHAVVAEMERFMRGETPAGPKA